MVSVWAYGVAIIDVLEHKSRDQFSRGRFRPTTEIFFWLTTVPFLKGALHQAFVLVCGEVTVISLDTATLRVSWAWAITTTLSGHASIIVHRHPGLVSAASCIVGRRVATTSPNQLLFDRFDDTELTDKSRVDITAHWNVGGRVMTRDCPVIIRSRRPDANPVDSVGLGLRCILCHRGGHDDVVRFLR